MPSLLRQVSSIRTYASTGRRVYRISVCYQLRCGLSWAQPQSPIFPDLCINNSGQEARFQNTAFRMSQSINRTPAFNINRTMDNVHFANLSEYLDSDVHDL